MGQPKSVRLLFHGLPYSPFVAKEPETTAKLDFLYAKLSCELLIWVLRQHEKEINNETDQRRRDVGGATQKMIGFGWKKSLIVR